ncbi:MAG: pitrilysin family protein [Planctomycetia bacterium]|nr:pitrilysin family protein [Planctomycetia bacterium]
MLNIKKLSNGLVVIGEVLPERSSVAFTFWTPAGSVYDPPDRPGMAAFLCEMMFRGAGDRSNRQFLEAIDQIGIDRCESLTAVGLGFRASMLAENFEAALVLYADLVRRPRLPRAELEDGRQVLLQEILSLRDDPIETLLRKMRERFYGRAWGHDSDGTCPGVKKITWEEVRRHYDVVMCPNEMVLSIAGNFDWKKTLALVETLFGDWEPRALPCPGRIRTSFRPFHISSDSQQTHMFLAWPVPTIGHPDQIRAWAGMNVLGGGMNSRLFNEVREKRGLCYSVETDYDSFPTRAGVFCYAGSRTENAKKTLGVIRRQMERLSRGITRAELEAVKVRYRTALVTQQESCSCWALCNLSDWRWFGRIRPWEEVQTRMERLTLREVNTWLAENPPKKFLTGTLGPRPVLWDA